MAETGSVALFSSRSFPPATKYLVFFLMMIAADAGFKFWFLGSALPLPFFAKQAGFYAGYGGVGRWNEFFAPLIYINTNSKQVLAVALTYFNVPNQATYQNLLMAAAVVSVIPVIIVFLFLQDYFVQGVTMTGLREG